MIAWKPRFSEPSRVPHFSRVLCVRSGDFPEFSLPSRKPGKSGDRRNIPQFLIQLPLCPCASGVNGFRLPLKKSSPSACIRGEEVVFETLKPLKLRNLRHQTLKPPPPNSESRSRPRPILAPFPPNVLTLFTLRRSIETKKTRRQECTRFSVSQRAQKIPH